MIIIIINLAFIAQGLSPNAALQNVEQIYFIPSAITQLVYNSFTIQNIKKY